MCVRPQDVNNRPGTSRNRRDVQPSRPSSWQIEHACGARQFRRDIPHPRGAPNIVAQEKLVTVRARDKSRTRINDRMGNNGRTQHPIVFGKDHPG
jgi:hypothetical protein